MSDVKAEVTVVDVPIWPHVEESLVQRLEEWPIMRYISPSLSFCQGISKCHNPQLREKVGDAEISLDNNLSCIPLNMTSKMKENL